MSDDGRWMVAVNAGSDDITVFRVVGAQLRQVAKAPSGGTRPVSVAIDDDLVYVLNASSDSIAGFRLNDRGQLRPLTNSVDELEHRRIRAPAGNTAWRWTPSGNEDMQSAGKRQRRGWFDSAQGRPRISMGAALSGSHCKD